MLRIARSIQRSHIAPIPSCLGWIILVGQGESSFFLAFWCALSPYFRDIRARGERFSAAKLPTARGFSDSQHFKSLRRGVLRAFWDLKAKTGCFFGQKSFSTQLSLFFS